MSDALLALILGTVLPALLPVVTAYVTTHVFAGVKMVLTVLDRAPALVQQAGVVVLAVLITAGYQAVGIDRVIQPGELSVLTQADVGGLVSGGLAIAMHAAHKAREARLRPRSA